MKIKAIQLKSFWANQDKILFILSIILLAVSFIYFVKGFHSLVLQNSNSAQDLFSRWQEQSYIYQGHYPYDINRKSPDVDPAIGPVTSGGYPPWAFFTNFILIPRISWQSTRWYFALLNLISLGIVAIFSYQIGAAYSRNKGLFSMASTLAVSAHVNTLNNGQYGIIINALLIGVYWLLNNHQEISAGILLALAFVKPNISGFYVFILFFRRQKKALLAFSAYLLFGSLMIWNITKVNPLYMVNKVLKQSSFFAKKGASGTNILIKLGIDPQLSIILLGILGIILTSLIFYFWAQKSLLILFATASVLGRVATYHWFYDNVMLIFVLFAVLKITFENNRKFDWFVLMLLAFSLWLPRNIVDLFNSGKMFEFIQCFIWVLALGWILFYEKLNQAWKTIRQP